MMITLNFAFWTFVIVFAIIGSMRGWAKEILVTSSVILALFILSLLNFIPAIRSMFNKPNGDMEFWIRTIILVIMVIFGYQTPNIARFASGKFMRDKLSDALLGFFLGALNGYLIVGTIWYFMIDSNYPLQPGIIPPNPIPAIANYLPPTYLQGVALYFAVMVSFLFVLIVFI
jgi:uncharacterized membrane protein required for colicin V production